MQSPTIIQASFSYIGTTGVVKNLTIEEGAVSFNSNGAVGAGIIAGANYGKIYNVKFIGGTINATSKSWLANTYFDIGGFADTTQAQSTEQTLRLSSTQALRARAL